MTDSETGSEQQPAGDASQPGKRRGYATANLDVVSLDDARYWSVTTAAELLGPPQLTESQVRQLIHLIHLEPAGKRPSGSRRRHVRVYDASKLARAYAAISCLLEEQ